ncbi:putative protein phosphatase 2C-like protein 44 [Vitis vinifera]|uniref:PPM-type phosphatase domain-containing protein n=1 Tax=Vitis vinifera TaxID=29760 RepID=A0A438CTP4_VITVI|nr:putative protein phosphatase 2C-like protein 44 [Vitis vinifera]
MGLKNLHLRLKAFRLRQLLVGDSRSKKRRSLTTQKPSWMVPISHGYHVIEDRSFGGACDCGFEEENSDSVVVQREQIEEMEVWFFGVSDSRIGDGITKYMQSHFFDRKPKESQISRKSKEAMKKAYLGAKAKVTEIENADEAWKVGSASAMVMNGEKLVLANMGDYRAVVCKDGVAHQIGRKHRHTGKQSWIRRLISGAFHMPKVRMLAFNSGTTGDDRQPKSLGVFVGAESIDSNTEFIILASTGIWEVIKNQEAVNLIRHIENAQEAAECLAKEALTRMSRSNISCLVIHFD